jgi:hypothetical protein
MEQPAVFEGFKADGDFGAADFDFQSFGDIGHRRRQVKTIKGQGSKPSR